MFLKTFVYKFLKYLDIYEVICKMKTIDKKRK